MTTAGPQIKPFNCVTQYGAEGSLNLNEGNAFTGRIGTKSTYKKKYSVQAMLDNDLVLSGAFTFRPKKGFKLTWSDQVNTKVLFTNPMAGVSYRYGFTLEANLL